MITPLPTLPPPQPAEINPFKPREKGMLVSSIKRKPILAFESTVLEHQYCNFL